MAYKKAARDTAKLRGQILTELKEDQLRHFQQQQSRMVEISNRIRSLVLESKLLPSKVAEATVALFHIGKERLPGAMIDALSENSQLQESQTQLLQEA